MPKFVDYTERVDQVRAAVFHLVLEEGTAAVTIARVAQALDISTSTLKRLVSSSAALPRLGLQWVSVRERRRWLPLLPGQVHFELETWERAVRVLEQRLPMDESRRDEERVFRAIAGAYRGAEWAREAAAERLQARDEALLRVLDELGCSGPDVYADLRLLVDGLVEAVTNGRMEPDDARTLLNERVQALHRRGQPAA